MEFVIKIPIPANHSKSKRIMLLLTRRMGETIRIGEDIEVIVLSINGKQVRLGITAPQEVAVHREEIQEPIREEELETTQADTAANRPALIRSGGGL